MSLTPVLEALIAMLVAVAIPFRAWKRYCRAAPPSPPGRYVPETLVLIALLLWALWLRGEPFARVGLEFPGLLRCLMDCAACLAVVLGVDLLALRLTARSIRRTRPIAVAKPLASRLGADGIAARQDLIGFGVVTLTGAIWEELCFRGWIFSLVPATFWGLFAGVAVGTALFGMQHLLNGISGMAYSSFFGLIFACLYLLTRNLVAVILAHFAGNMFAVVYGGPWIARMREQQALKAVFLG